MGICVHHLRHPGLALQRPVQQWGGGVSQPSKLGVDTADLCAGCCFAWWWHLPQSEDEEHTGNGVCFVTPAAAGNFASWRQVPGKYLVKRIDNVQTWPNWSKMSFLQTELPDRGPQCLVPLIWFHVLDLQEAQQPRFLILILEPSPDRSSIGWINARGSDPAKLCRLQILTRKYSNTRKQDAAICKIFVCEGTIQRLYIND